MPPQALFVKNLDEEIETAAAHVGVIAARLAAPLGGHWGLGRPVAAQRIAATSLSDWAAPIR